ncbi:ABC transporter permease [Actinomadura alba]|uniref:ABC transporter permease n=1 Tax=Actinomadura alba TaxID=406431 RepID=A0ABR7LQG3_9ACTN|nr:ABC transporter permease [Actinomadura alba]MBC6466720.1 ABC transporter permease [Actinomadura alba]
MSTTKPTGAPVASTGVRTGGALGRNTQRLNEIGLIGAIVVLFVVLSVTASGFLTMTNQLAILRDAATIGVVAWAMTLVIVAGEIDISIGPAVAFSSVLLAKATGEWHLPFALALLLCLAVGLLLGAGAGFLRARWAIPSFVATLGLWSALRGLAQYMTDGLPVPLAPNGLLDLLSGSILGIPTPAIIMAVLFAVFVFVANRTSYGRSVFAVGGNAEAARLSGISVARIRVILFATTGFLAAVSGVLLAARLGSGNGGASVGLEFDVIAAVVIGGTSLAGGRGSLLGTALGVAFITIIGNGLVLLGVNPFFQDVVRGVIIVGAVLINVLLSRRNGARTT